MTDYFSKYKLAITPLAATLAIIALRFAVVYLGITTAEKADSFAQALLGNGLTVIGFGWAVIQATMSHFHKKALANARPGTVKGA